jgi:hypothetical protein
MTISLLTLSKTLLNAECRILFIVMLNVMESVIMLNITILRLFKLSIVGPNYCHEIFYSTGACTIKLFTVVIYGFS